jgi:DNA-binding transcriptional MerR regulator
MSAAELAAATGTTARAIRHYLEIGALPPAEFHGRATRYTREHALRLFAIAGLRRQRFGLEAIRRRLAVMSLAELEAHAPPPPEKQTPTRGLEPPPPPTYTAERWDVVPLLRGLSLMVHAGASPAVKRLAQEIFDHCVRAEETAERETAAEP